MSHISVKKYQKALEENQKISHEVIRLKNELNGAGRIIWAIVHQLGGSICIKDSTFQIIDTKTNHCTFQAVPNKKEQHIEIKTKVTDLRTGAILL